MFHGDGRARVRRRQGEMIDAWIQPTVGNCGPSVMVWGAIHHGGRSELVVLDGTLNCQHYIRLLRDSMLPCATGVIGRNCVYGQDNAMSNTAPDTIDFLAQQDVEVMDWPAQCPVNEPHSTCLG